ncbi:MAG TPA: CocE/NonD family hydrolase, partial [Candidatus Thermoplasmatota archaeon]|nr:CocE/NonD family hydrolase [Candidatus Thermoplasmatota archaeon]
LILPGCLSPDAEVEGASAPRALSPYPYDAAFDETDAWSRTLVNGTLGRLPVEEVSIPSFDGVKLHMGVFRPDVPEGTKVPVIVDAGPYYLDGDEAATSDQTHRLGGFLIENFVPHGYAVVQASIRGTGLSGGCVDYMGEKEQKDLDAIVTYLGEAEWSNGRVGMIGRSYDGSTPWEAATFGNPYLRTIVPISGITDLQQLHYRNGSAELRSLFLGTLYYSYGATVAGLGGPEEDPTLVPRMACAEGAQHTPMGAAGYATGGGKAVPGPAADYWNLRHFGTRVLENYNGSIFYIHGLQDWNVWPSQGADVYNAFEGKKKALLGQWGHNYPDRPDEHEHLRWDWAEMLLRWFDSELKGVPDVDTGPAVEVEDHRGNWRAEPDNAWPPLDAEWMTLFPSADGTLVAEGASGAATLFAPGVRDVGLPEVPDTPATRTDLVFESEPFANLTRVSGMPQLHLTVVPSTTGGHLYAHLIEVPEKGEPVLIGRAQMDLRYAAGGMEMQPVVPQTPIVARMEFYPLDARILPGSRLVLHVTQEIGLDPIPSAETGPVEIRFGDDSPLRLPIVDRPFVPSRWDVVEGEVKQETA